MLNLVIRNHLRVNILHTFAEKWDPEVISFLRSSEIEIDFVHPTVHLMWAGN